MTIPSAAAPIALQTTNGGHICPRIRKIAMAQTVDTHQYHRPVFPNLRGPGNNDPRTTSRVKKEIGTVRKARRSGAGFLNPIWCTTVHVDKS